MLISMKGWDQTNIHKYIVRNINTDIPHWLRGAEDAISLETKIYNFPENFLR